MKLMIEQERKGKGWTQKYVSEQLGITREAYSLIENNKRKPSYDVLVKLLALFGYKDPRELFAEVPEPPISMK